MCNAWNHAPGCSCGWGGAGWSQQPFNTSNVGVPPLRPDYVSFTIPNACCPVCGGLVFFYQSATGGRVFFDELGPPWPKHPCTDASSHPKPRVAEEARLPDAARAPDYRWQREGWLPFEIHSVVGVDKDFLKLTGAMGAESVVIYLKRFVRHHLPDNALSERSLALLRRRSSSVELAFLLPSGKPSGVQVYGTLADAHVAQKAQRQAESSTRARDRGAPRQKQRTHVPSRSDTSTDKARTSGVETTLARALRRAQERSE